MPKIVRTLNKKRRTETEAINVQFKFDNASVIVDMEKGNQILVCDSWLHHTDWPPIKDNQALSQLHPLYTKRK